MTKRGVAAAWGALGVLAILVIWEVYKFLGPADGFVVGAIEGETGSGVMILPRAHDRAMPHIWEMVGRLFQSTSGGSTPPLIVPVVSAALLTLGIAAVGWFMGVLVGSLLGLVMQRWRLAEWGLLPWIVVSQTVPLIAFAPIVASIGSQIDRGGTPWPQWLSVAVIASYLSFFPVAVGVL
ncbi:MAG: ABC transporter permease, partial [Rhodoglobus sp.]